MSLDVKISFIAVFMIIMAMLDAILCSMQVSSMINTTTYTICALKNRSNKLRYKVLLHSLCDDNNIRMVYYICYSVRYLYLSLADMLEYFLELGS